ncbi:MAG: 6-phosphogluconolactonase [Gemmatimonadaceae bacterium]
MAEPDIHVASVDALTAIFVQRFALEARRAIAERARFSVVVPGGSVATAFLPQLLSQPLPWDRCDVFWGDERAVPLDSPDSNAGAQEALWAVRAPAASLYHMEGAASDLNLAATSYGATLRSALGDSPRLDIVILGAGEDGHIASLFPGHAALELTSPLVTVVEDSPKPPPRRLTMTLPLLAGARWLCIAAFGASKAAAVGEALANPASPLPLARVLRESARATVLLDEAAAHSLIERA